MCAKGGLQRRYRVEKALKKRREFQKGIEILKNSLDKLAQGNLKISLKCTHKDCKDQFFCRLLCLYKSDQITVEISIYNRHDIYIYFNPWVRVTFRVHAKSPEFRCNHSFIANLYDSHFLPQIEGIIHETLNNGEQGITHLVSSYLF